MLTTNSAIYKKRALLRGFTLRIHADCTKSHTVQNKPQVKMPMSNTSAQ